MDEKALKNAIIISEAKEKYNYDTDLENTLLQKKNMAKHQLLYLVLIKFFQINFRYPLISI